MCGAMVSCISSDDAVPFTEGVELYVMNSTGETVTVHFSNAEGSGGEIEAIMWDTTAIPLDLYSDSMNFEFVGARGASNFSISYEVNVREGRDFTIALEPIRGDIDTSLNAHQLFINRGGIMEDRYTSFHFINDKNHLVNLR